MRWPCVPYSYDTSLSGLSWTSYPRDLVEKQMALEGVCRSSSFLTETRARSTASIAMLCCTRTLPMRSLPSSHPVADVRPPFPPIIPAIGWANRPQPPVWASCAWTKNLHSALPSRLRTVLVLSAILPSFSSPAERLSFHTHCTVSWRVSTAPTRAVR